MPCCFPVLCCAMLCHAEPSHAVPCRAVSCSNEPHCAILCPPGLFHAMLCHVKLCSVLPCHTVPCYASPQAQTAHCRLRSLRRCPCHLHRAALFMGCPFLSPRGQAGVPMASTHCSLQPAGPHRAPTHRIAVALTPSPTADSGNRWQEEALGHHQLLLSLADDTECKFCWHYSLRLFCLYIPPVLITVIEL